MSAVLTNTDYVINAIDSDGNQYALVTAATSEIGVQNLPVASQPTFQLQACTIKSDGTVNTISQSGTSALTTAQTFVIHFGSGNYATKAPSSNLYRIGNTPTTASVFVLYSVQNGGSTPLTNGVAFYDYHANGSLVALGLMQSSVKNIIGQLSDGSGSPDAYLAQLSLASKTGPPPAPVCPTPCKAWETCTTGGCAPVPCGGSGGSCPTGTTCNGTSCGPPNPCPSSCSGSLCKCAPDGSCLRQTCVPGTVPPPGTVCVNGWLQYTCPQGCGPNERCSDGMCVPTSCIFNGDCPQGYKCDGANGCVIDPSSPITKCAEGTGILQCGTCVQQPCDQPNGIKCPDGEYCDGKGSCVKKSTCSSGTCSDPCTQCSADGTCEPIPMKPCFKCVGGVPVSQCAAGQSCDASGQCSNAPPTPSPITIPWDAIIIGMSVLALGGLYYYFFDYQSAKTTTSPPAPKFL